MNKTAFLVAAMAVLTQTFTENEIIQQGLNGVFN